MAYRHWAHPSQNTIAALGIALMLGGHAVAQTVPIFNDAPTISRLPGITILELQPSLGGTIVLPRLDTPAPYDLTAGRAVGGGAIASSDPAAEMSGRATSPQPLPSIMRSLTGTVPSAGRWFMHYVLWLWRLLSFHRIGLAARPEAQPSDNRPLEWVPPPMP